MITPTCPICGASMVFFNGCGWDYDRWVCMAKIGTDCGKPVFCAGEIELDESTYPEGFDDGN